MCGVVRVELAAWLAAVLGPVRVVVNLVAVALAGLANRAHGTAGDGDGGAVDAAVIGRHHRVAETLAILAGVAVSAAAACAAVDPVVIVAPDAAVPQHLLARLGVADAAIAIVAVHLSASGAATPVAACAVPIDSVGNAVCSAALTHNGKTPWLAFLHFTGCGHSDAVIVVVVVVVVVTVTKSVVILL